MKGLQLRLRGQLGLRLDLELGLNLQLQREVVDGM